MELFLKAQASVEFLVLVAFFVMLLVPFIYLFFTSANVAKDDVSVAQAQQAVGKIASSADEVYFGGPGTRVFVEVYIPPGVRDVVIGGGSGREITFILETASGRNDAVAMTSANVSTSTNWASRRLSSGTVRMNITFVPSGNVTVDLV